MQVDLEIFRKELEKLSDEEILRMSVLLPKNIYRFYNLKNKDMNVRKFFGFQKKEQSEIKRKYLPLEEAIKVLHPLKFSTYTAFRVWRKTNQINNIPQDLVQHYRVPLKYILGKSYKRGNTHAEYFLKEYATKPIQEENKKSRYAWQWAF